MAQKEAKKYTESINLGSGYDVDAYEKFGKESIQNVKILDFTNSSTQNPNILGEFVIVVNGSYSYEDDMNGKVVASTTTKKEEVKPNVPEDSKISEGNGIAKISIPSSLSYMSDLVKVAGKEKDNGDGTYTLTTELLSYSNNGYSWQEHYNAQVTYKKDSVNLFNGSFYNLVIYKERTKNPIYNKPVNFNFNFIRY